MLPAKLIALLRGRVFVLTGAGVSAASGIQTFRGDEGLYRGLDPYTLASPEGFFNDPATVWNWYLMRVRSAWDARPNRAHLALAELEKEAEEFTLVTSNVDPLHDLAGSTSYRLHGDILQTICAGCGAVARLNPGRHPEEVDDETLPTCRACGGLLRPNVVWFGESPWTDGISAIRVALPRAQIFLEVGTSGAVSYGLDEMAVGMGIPVVRINPDPRPAEGVTEINAPAEVALPELLAMLGNLSVDDGAQGQ